MKKLMVILLVLACCGTPVLAEVVVSQNETWMFSGPDAGYAFNSSGDPYDVLYVGPHNADGGLLKTAAVQLDLSAYAGQTVVGDGTLSFYARLENGHTEQYPPLDAWWIHELTKDYDVTEASWNVASAGDPWTTGTGGEKWSGGGCQDRGDAVGNYRVPYDNTDWTLKEITVSQAQIQSWLGDDTVSLHFAIKPDYYFSGGPLFAYKVTNIAGNGAGTPAGPTLTFTPEPATMLLLSLGGLFLRKRRS